MERLWASSAPWPASDAGSSAWAALPPGPGPRCLGVSWWLETSPLTRGPHCRSLHAQECTHTWPLPRAPMQAQTGQQAEDLHMLSTILAAMSLRPTGWGRGGRHADLHLDEQTGGQVG